ncbi:type I polyketide synthase [Gynuella sp.]|uniref:type I polyketide synthase n=1 Tax=Gynuella sp. TaxID=2969146 RepID=UPI003D147E96
MNLPEGFDQNDIAIVGMSGAFPGAENIDEFWNMLLNGGCGIRDLSDDELQQAGISKELYQQPNYVKRAAPMAGAKYFDPAFFGYSDAEAELMDPQHRVFMQHVWWALENAGYIPDQIEEAVGIYAGCSLNRYMLNSLDINTEAFDVAEFQKMLASEKDYLTTRVAYKLNLRGPAINVQSACSTSLVATQLAALSLQTYQCDVAICGGVTIHVPHAAGYLYCDGLIYSPDGRCRPFGADANGTMFGDGVGVVVLKRLEDALATNDRIWAVIKGAAVNNDGRDKVGFTAPSAGGQAEVISLATELAGIQPQQLHFIETHGTGTKMGDPIELAGLNTAFSDALEHEQPFCALGALKSNIGHLDSAAGIAALIKTILVVHHRQIPPSVCRENATPSIEGKNSPFFFNHEVINHQPDQILYAGVSSFGVGGTNAHVVLSSPPSQPQPPATQATDLTLLLHSARSTDALIEGCNKIQAFAAQYPEQQTNMAFTLLRHKAHYLHRTFSLFEKGIALQERDQDSVQTDGKLAFAFPGQGVQYPGMLVELYQRQNDCRTAFDHCISILQKLTDRDFKAVIFGNQDITDTADVQVTLFVAEYVLARTLMALGIQPDCMIGHSLGEYAAACIAGVMSLEDTLAMVVTRGRAMASAAPGAMVIALTDRTTLNKLLTGSLTVAVENTASNYVVSGTEADITALINQLEQNQIKCIRLTNQHAFHSAAMDSVLEQFRTGIEHVHFNAPTISLISATNGFEGEPFTSADYWVYHLRNTVHFYDVIQQLHDQNTRTVLEVGPGSSIASLIKQSEFNGTMTAITTVPPEKHQQQSWPHFARALARLWCRGQEVDFQATGLITAGHKISLPGYAFEQREFWKTKTIVRRIQASTQTEAQTTQHGLMPRDARNDLDHSIVAVWEKVLGKQQISIDDDFFNLGGDSVSALLLIDQMTRATGLEFRHSAIFEHHTIRHLVDHLGEKAEHNAIVVRLNQTETGTPVFCLGGVKYYQPLADSLSGRHPVYAIFTHKEIAVVHHKHPIDFTLQTLIDAYAGAIQRQTNRTDIIIAGLSFGGLMALDVANQLNQNGFDIRKVIMFDSFIDSSHQLSVRKFLLDYLDRIQQHGFFSYSTQKLLELWKQYRRHLKTAVGTPAASGSQQQVKAFSQLAELYHINGKHYPFEVLLFRALNRYIRFGKVAKPDYGFGEVVEGKLSVVDIPADHLELINDHHIGLVQEAIDRFLGDRY